jgi:hypothetical protein
MLFFSLLTSQCLVPPLLLCSVRSPTRQHTQVVRWQPRVLSMSNSSVKLKTIALASVVGVPPSAIHDICAKQPLLLNLSAKSLVAKTRALKEVLGYSDLQLWQVVFTKPGVLLFATDKLRAKWDSLQQLAGEGRARVWVRPQQQQDQQSALGCRCRFFRVAHAFCSPLSRSPLLHVPQALLTRPCPVL